MHPVLGTMMPEICEAPHFSCQPRLHTQIVGMRSLHSPMTSLKTSIKTITYLSDIDCLEIQGASLISTQTKMLEDFRCLAWCCCILYEKQNVFSYFLTFFIPAIS